jgi:hypothetical protein
MLKPKLIITPFDLSVRFARGFDGGVQSHNRFADPSEYNVGTELSA